MWTGRSYGGGRVARGPRGGGGGRPPRATSGCFGCCLWRCGCARSASASGFPRECHRAVDRNHLLGQPLLVEVTHGIAAGHPPVAPQHTLERRRNGLRSIIVAQLTPLHVLEPQRHVAHPDGHDREIASQRLFDDVRRTFLTRRKDQRVRKVRDRKSTRLNSSHVRISYAVFCLKKKNP